MFLPCAESSHVLSLLLTFLQELLQELPGLLDAPSPCPSWFGSKPETWGARMLCSSSLYCSCASHQSQVKLQPSWSPVGPWMGQRVPPVQVLIPVTWGFWEASPWQGEGMQPQLHVRRSLPGLVCVLLSDSGGRLRADSDPLQELAARTWRRRRAHELCVGFLKLLGFSSWSRDSLGL